MKQHPEIATGLEARLSKVERQLRRTNRLAFSLAALLVAGATIGMVQEPAEKNAAAVVDRVAAHAFILVDEDGKPVGVWGMSAGKVVLGMMSPANVAELKQSTLRLEVGEDGGGITGASHSGSVPAGSAGLAWGRGGAHLALEGKSFSDVGSEAFLSAGVFPGLFLTDSAGQSKSFMLIPKIGDHDETQGG